MLRQRAKRLRYVPLFSVFYRLVENWRSDVNVTVLSARFTARVLVYECYLCKVGFLSSRDVYRDVLRENFDTSHSSSDSYNSVELIHLYVETYK